MAGTERPETEAQRNNLTTAERNALVVGIYPWIRSCARAYWKPGSDDFDDLVQVAALGAMRAAETFDPARARFITYAGWWIRAYLSRHEDRRRAADNPIDPTLGIYEDHKGRRRRARARKVHLDAPLPGAEDGERRLADVVANDDLPADVRAMRTQEHTAAVAALLRVVNFDPVFRNRKKRFRAILVINHRLLPEEGESLEQVGARMGMSRERARQIEAELLERARTILRAAA